MAAAPVTLSPNFTLEELEFSELAARQGIDNTPPASAVASLGTLARTLLEPARTLLGVPIHVNSGYRSLAVNTALGGARNSAHLDGRAADCVPIGMALQTAFDLLRHSADLPYDQIILECNAWIHLAIAGDDEIPRRQALTASGHAGAWSYQEIS